ncbi:GAF domain-containing protein [Actinoplanes sp. NEAU-A12]|uniref:GAF domain-containing protein n=1 Tax=Actinoplanes sandaracinus TaxID=3045177 RepID=A0ABT6WNS4_9ACTN|nr:GAF domain-containing protein [Actinoplanes sandaracinus]MDI6101385.1 GAF domain-containing protein [Actinoplanes sandaracinus]
MTTPDGRSQQLLRQLVSALRARGGITALATSCHQQLPDLDGVTVSIYAGSQGWLLLSDSGPHADQLEDLQNRLDQGPRLDAVTHGEPVVAADLTAPVACRRWPAFTAWALAHGIRAVFTFTVVHDASPIGVLTLYRGTAGPLTAQAVEHGARYALAAAVLLLDTMTVNRAGDLHMTMPAGAAAVQQAVGMVMAHTGADADTALHLLRAHADKHARPMHEVVSDTLAGRLTFRPDPPDSSAG